MADRGIAYRTPEADTITYIGDLPGRDYRWIQRAIGVAMSSDHRTKIGALAMRGGNLRGIATNRFRNHPRVVPDWYECSVHAEQSLIENYDVSGSIVYVARVRARNAVAIAKPCKSCLKLLIKAGVKRIVWTEDEHHAGIMGLG
jgi:deoxycytidylate deaminase